MTTPEFSRMLDVRQVSGRAVTLTATPEERAALARRLGIVRIDRLEAEVSLDRAGEVVTAEGTLAADIVQACAVSAEDLPSQVREGFSFRFVPASEHRQPDEEVELDAEDCDEIEYSGSTVDVGEAVAQSLALAIDPFATGPEAEAARALLKDEDASPFAILKGFGKQP